MSAIPTIEMPKPGVAEKRVNEMFLAGLLSGAIVGVNLALFIEFDRFLLGPPPNFGFFFSNLIVSLTNFLVNPCLTFAIFHLWGSKRVSLYFRDNYLRIVLLLFLGSAIGYTVTYFALLFAMGATGTFPTLLSLIVWSLANLLQIVGIGLGIAFVGFTALGISYFRRSKKIVIAEENTVQSGTGSSP